MAVDGRFYRPKKLFSLQANAEGIEGYAQYDNNSDTLTFYEGESVPDDALRLNTGEDAPGWAGNLNTKGVGCGL